MICMHFFHKIQPVGEPTTQHWFDKVLCWLDLWCCAGTHMLLLLFLAIPGILVPLLDTMWKQQKKHVWLPAVGWFQNTKRRSKNALSFTFNSWYIYFKNKALVTCALQKLVFRVRVMYRVTIRFMVEFIFTPSSHTALAVSRSPQIMNV